MFTALGISSFIINTKLHLPQRNLCGDHKKGTINKMKKAPPDSILLGAGILISLVVVPLRYQDFPQNLAHLFRKSPKNLPTVR